MNQSEALKKLIEGIPGKTLAAKLRQIMPEIDGRVREGVQHQEIIEALNENGFDLNLNTFRSYLYRYRKKVRESRRVSEPPESDQKADGNPSGEESGAETPHGEKAQEASLEDILDSTKRDEISEKYMSRKRPIFGTKRSKNK